MWDKIRHWYLNNYTEITWFIIGFLVMDCLVQFSRGNWAGAFLSLGLVVLNYLLAKRT